MFLGILWLNPAVAYIRSEYNRWHNRRHGTWLSGHGMHRPLPILGTLRAFGIATVDDAPTVYVRCVLWLVRCVICCMHSVYRWDVTSIALRCTAVTPAIGASQALRSTADGKQRCAATSATSALRCVIA